MADHEVLLEPEPVQPPQQLKLPACSMSMLAFQARPIVELKQRDKSKIEALLAYGDRLLIGLSSGSLRIYRLNREQQEEEDQKERKDADNNGGGDNTASDADSANHDDSSSQRPRPAKPAELLREVDKFSRYRIEQLAVIKEAGFLVCLSAGMVTIHDHASYDQVETLSRAKGATTFAVTSNVVHDAHGVPSIVSRLAVAVKRRLLIWAWQDAEPLGGCGGNTSGASSPQEITLSAGIKTLVWATGTRVLAGLGSSFVLVDVETSRIIDITGPGAIGGTTPGNVGDHPPPSDVGGRFSAGIGYMGMGGMVPKPLATRLHEGELLLARDVNTHFIDPDGAPLPARDGRGRRRQIPWASGPDAIGYSYPFLLALHAASSPKAHLEVRNPDTLSALQSVSVPGASMLHVPNPNVSLAHAGKGFFVSADRCVWRMHALPYDAQIDSLIARGSFDEATSLLEMLEAALLKDKEGRLKEARVRKAVALFDAKRYRDAMDWFGKANASPKDVIALYPMAIAGPVKPKRDERSQQDEDEGRKDTKSLKGDDEAPTTERPRSPAPSQTSILSSPFRSKKAKKEEKRPQTAHGHGQTNVVVPVPLSEIFHPREIDAKDLRSATLELASFLVGVRTRIQGLIRPDGSFKEVTPNDAAKAIRELSPYTIDNDDDLLSKDQSAHTRLLRIAQLVDTTLFRAYMLANPSMAGPLFRLPNFCAADAVREKLLESHRYTDLIDFYFGKGMHRDALQLLLRLGKNDSSSSSSSEKEKDRDAGAVPATLRGPRRLIAYLSSLPAERVDLILDFAEWPIKEDPEEAMDIFVADTENAEELPRDRVLAFLEGVGGACATRYLEHIIHELNDTTPEFHLALVDRYLAQMAALKEAGGKGKAKEEEEAAKECREKLLSFLKTSKHYEPWKALRKLPKDNAELDEARAIVLGKMGEHRQALDIYVFKIKDPAKAEEYCNQVHLAQTASSFASSSSSSSPPSPTSPSTITTTANAMSPTGRAPGPYHGGAVVDDSSPPSIYAILLGLYLNPPRPHEPQWQPALELLARHGARLPASSTLALVPEVLPVRRLEEYFLARLRAGASARAQAQIEAGLRTAQDLRTDVALKLGDVATGTTAAAASTRGRNRCVVITEGRVCGVCHKRFGGSAIKVLPDNNVVHYGCAVR